MLGICTVHLTLLDLVALTVPVEQLLE